LENPADFPKPVFIRKGLCRDAPQLIYKHVRRHALDQTDRMTKYLIILGGLIFCLGCRVEKEPIITIVNIGHLDRNGIAKELRIVNKYHPRVVGLDFLLTTDSLGKDILLKEELSKTKNIVQATKLHNNHTFYNNSWDSLDRYHFKFRFGLEGFSNYSITDDSVIVREFTNATGLQE